MSLSEVHVYYIHFVETSYQRKRIDQALVNMIVTDLQPISIVEDQGFIKFVKVLDPKYTPPSCRAIMRDHLPRLYETETAILKTKLEKWTGVLLPQTCGLQGLQWATSHSLVISSTVNGR